MMKIFLIFVFILVCSLQNKQADREIKQLILETDLSNESSVSNFVENTSKYGQKVIPILLRSWENNKDFAQLSFICESIYQIGDSSLYSTLVRTFSVSDDLKVKQILSFLLFHLHIQEIMLSKNYGNPSPKILELSIFSMADTSLKFPNPDMSHLGMVSFAGFEVFTKDITDSETDIYEAFENDDYKSLKNLVSKWYEKNKNNLAWDSQKRQFVLK